jgi:hypothetical protein
MKETKEKIRADRNRTLTVSDLERNKLTQNLVRIDDVQLLQSEEIVIKLY